MTKFSEEFCQKVRKFYYEGKKKKKFQGDKTFTIDDVVNEFGILPNQAKRNIHVKGRNNKFSEDIVSDKFLQSSFDMFPFLYQ